MSTHPQLSTHLPPDDAMPEVEYEVNDIEELYLNVVPKDKGLYFLPSTARHVDTDRTRYRIAT